VLSVWSCVVVSLLFDPPGFFLTSLSCLSVFVSRSVSQFGGELAAIKADGPYSHPAPLDADVAGLDVPFADPGLRSALWDRSSGAVVSFKVYHKCAGILEAMIFLENKSGPGLVVADQHHRPLPLAGFEVHGDGRDVSPISGLEQCGGGLRQFVWFRHPCAHAFDVW
jgi:hypothetical protein